MNTYWVSFADNRTTNNLGVVLVDAENEKAALAEIRRLGLYPEGDVEAAVWEMNTTKEAKAEITKMGKNHFISKQELLSAEYNSIRI